MRRIVFTKTLPLVPYVGAFGVLSSCGCGHCPACAGSTAVAVSMLVFIGTKKLLSSLKGGKTGKSDERNV